jgi:DNA-binding CsgD family transcriptional regulator
MNNVKLSPREARVLDALLEHGRDKLIARELGVAPRTVEVYLYNVRNKLRAAGNLEGKVSRIALMRWWMDRQAVAQ